MGLFGSKYDKWNNDNKNTYTDENYTTDFLEGACWGAWTSLLLLNIFDKDKNDESLSNDWL